MSQDFNAIWPMGGSQPQGSPQQPDRRMSHARSSAFPTVSSQPQQSYRTNAWLTAEFPWNSQGVQNNLKPWSSGAVPVSSQRSADVDYSGQAFNQVRSTHTQSVYDTSYVGSGYDESAPLHTPATSVIDTSSTLNPRIPTLFGACNLGGGPTPFPPASVTSGGSAPKHTCSECGASMKTLSEFKKHQKRHDKPHKCPNEGCDKGFPSPNDLERHRCSVHKEFNLVAKVYRCTHCQGRPKDHFWPRADNFRIHLKKRHDLEFKIEELTPFELTGQAAYEEYISTSRQPTLLDGKPGNALSDASVVYDNHDAPQVPVAQPMVGFSQSLPDSATPQDDNVANTALQFSMDEALQGLSTAECEPQASARDTMTPPQAKPEHISSFGHDADLTTERERRVSADCDQHSAIFDSADEAESTSAEDSQQAQDATWRNGCDTPSTNSQPASSAVDHETLRRLEGAVSSIGSDPSELFELLDRVPSEVLRKALASRLADQPQKKNEECPECSKRFSRPCELKKHLKRHQRPYGCTYPKCKKTFGSKNDWKRHEKNQHKPVQTWICDIETCEKSCDERESFNAHLLHDHSMTESRHREDKLDSCRQGSHCEESFWCGFCIKWIPREGTLNCQGQRFDHIDDHLFGKNDLVKKSRDEWIYSEKCTSETSTSETTQQGGSSDDQMHDGASTPGSKTREGPLLPQKRKLSDTNPTPLVQVEACGNSDDDSKEIGVTDGDGVIQTKTVEPPGANEEQATASRTGRKRRRTIMWDCCNCAFAMMNYEHTRSCVSCGHQTASDCCCKRYGID